MQRYYNQYKSKIDANVGLQKSSGNNQQGHPSVVWGSYRIHQRDYAQNQLTTQQSTGGGQCKLD